MYRKEIYLCGNCMKVIAFGTRSEVVDMKTENVSKECEMCKMKKEAVLCVVDCSEY